jgi:hypothetical protein
MKKVALALLLLILPVAAFAALPQITNTATVTANNAFTANGDGTMTVTTGVQTTVPTLSSAGLAALVIVLAAVAVYRVRRRARAV